MADEPESERTEDADAQDTPADEPTDEAERAAETADDADSNDSGSAETDDEAAQSDEDGSDAPETSEATDDVSAEDDDERDTGATDDDHDDADSDGSDSTEAADESERDDDSRDEGGETETDADAEDDASDNLQQVSSDRGDDEERRPDEAGADDGSESADGESVDDDSADDDDVSADDDESEPEYVEDASLDDDFPVAGMSEEDVAWDPEETASAEELGLDEEEIDTPGDEDDTQFAGVKPEKQEIDDSLWGEGPESDQEMPLADHIEEMMRRLGVVFVIAGAVSLTVLGLAQTIEWLPTAVDIIDILWNHNIPGAPEDAGRRPRVYGPLELVLTKLKVAGLAGILVGLPAFVYETYLFMRPGLYPRERKYYLAAVPTSLILAAIGMTFAHFVVLPVIFDYFTSYTEGTATIAFGLSETFNLIILLMGYMAIVFQIPLFIMLAIMMNLVTRIWLEDKRLLFWGAFAGLAFLVSPDPTGMAPIIIAATMIVLYEGTLALLRWTGN
jgi:sec-independent protein translocase protein TatC